MKKLYAPFSKFTIALLFLLGSSWQANAQCAFTFAATDSVICPGDTATITALPPPTTLLTTFAAGNNHRGNMFDIVALNAVTITGFDVHPQGNTTVEVYYKVGGYAGSETTPAAWTLVGSAAVVAQPLGTPTPLPLAINVAIPAGQTYAFYVTSNNVGVSLNYTNGNAAGNVWSQDANIQFLEGAGMEYPFTNGGGTFTPRVWNGNIHYTLPGPTTYNWSTGDTTASISVSPTDTTSYSVAVNISGCGTLIDSFQLNVVQPPLVDLGPDALICNGDTAFLDAGNPGSTYLWSDNSTAQTLNTTADGTYAVTVTNAGGCNAVDSITVNYHNTMVDLGPDTAVCGSVTLDAGNPGGSFLWSDSTTNQTLDVTTTGSYTVEINDINGCYATDDVFVIVSPLPTVDLGPDYQICVNHTSVLDAGTATSYSWSTGETTSTISIDGSVLGVGAHTISVTVTDANGCSNTDDVVVTVDGCVGMSEMTAALPISIYPNPTQSTSTLQLDLEKAAYTRIVLVNALGQEVMVIADASLPIGNQQFDINLSTLNNGIYFVQVVTNGKTFSRKLIKE